MYRVGYIISYMFSGSTVLSLMLAAHPEIATVGELIGVNPKILGNKQAALNYLCSCGKKVIECSFWNELSNRLKKRGINFCHPYLGTRFSFSNVSIINSLFTRSMPNNAIQTLRERFVKTIPPFKNQFYKIASVNASSVEEILKMTGKKVLIDESKDHIHFMRLASIQGLDVRPIFLTRDGRGVALSVRNHGIIKDFRHAVKSWIRVNKSALRTITATKRFYLHVRYEDLCAMPSETLQKIHRFLDLDPKPWPPQNLKYEHHVLGNDMRVMFDGVINLDTKWKYEITTQELNYFPKIAGKMIAALGYDKYV